MHTEVCHMLYHVLMNALRLPASCLGMFSVSRATETFSLECKTFLLGPIPYYLKHPNNRNDDGMITY
jgi:hypothetical protein